MNKPMEAAVTGASFRSYFVILATALALSVSFSADAVAKNKKDKAVKGAIVGAGIGALLGDGKGAVVGGIAGALIGKNS